jgi:hypothetical protein
MRALKAGVIYFLLVFALGWALGPIRELWAVPRFGRLTVLLFEAVIMLIAMIISARWVMRRFEVHQTLGSTTLMGLVALGILVPAEIAGVLWVRGLSLREYLARPRPRAGSFREPIVRRLTAGGNGIRTRGPSSKRIERSPRPIGALWACR